MKPTKANFLKLLGTTGGTCEQPVPPAWHLGDWSMNIDAPVGYIWTGDGVHCRVAVGTTKTELWEDAINGIDMGLDACEDLDCDACTSARADHG